jgi:hypothetical protein
MQITPELTREKVLACALGAADETGKEAAV